MIDPPKRAGYRLTYDAECLYNDWQEIGGCTCFLGCAPCYSCCHYGNPISLEENDEAWELDEGEEDMSRQDITDKSDPPKSEWFGYKYRVTPESSKLLQEAVFKDGGSWLAGASTTLYEKEPYIYVETSGLIVFGNDDESFERKGMPEKQPPQAKKDFVVGKYYKCVGGYSFSNFLVGCYYKLAKINGNLLFTEDMYNYVSREGFDINSESDYDPNAKKVVDTEVKGSKLTTYRAEDVTVSIGGVSLESHIHLGNKSGNNATTTVGDTNMSTNTQRKTVTVNLLDRDTALDEKFALVATFGEFTTSKSSEALIRSIIIDPKNDVAKLITQHNDVRTKQTNKEILDRTGNKVTLEAVEESDLYWEIR